MRLNNLLSTALLFTLGFTSCKKDGVEKEDEGGGGGGVFELRYDGKSYNIEKGRIWDYKFNKYPSHYTYTYYMSDGLWFSQEGDYELGPNDPPISLFYNLSVRKSSSLMQGDFSFLAMGEDWYLTGLPESAKEKNVFTFAAVGFDANGDRVITPAEVIPVTGGVINLNADISTYDLTLGNGKTLKGSIKTSTEIQLPPS